MRILLYYYYNNDDIFIFAMTAFAKTIVVRLRVYYNILYIMYTLHLCIPTLAPGQSFYAFLLRYFYMYMSHRKRNFEYYVMKKCARATLVVKISRGRRSFYFEISYSRAIFGAFASHPH